MWNITKQLQQELYKSNCEHLYELDVVDNAGNTEWVGCSIKFIGNSLVAQHIGLNSKEEASKFIANTRVVVDSDLTLDEHLEILLDAIQEKIIASDLFQLAD
jgi:hypothetical protein